MWLMAVSLRPSKRMCGILGPRARKKRRTGRRLYGNKLSDQYA